MKINLRPFYFFTFLCLFLANTAFGTHNRAGEITYVQTGDLTIVATITTYTKASSDQADRDSLTIEWGDGTFSRLPRVNGGGNGEILPGDIKFNTYRGEHTYPGRSTYTMSLEDPNRISNILNINNSIAVRFYIETTITFLNPQFQGYNSSAILLQRPIDEACVGQRFIHLPNAYDPDNDSLSFELITPLQGMGSNVPDYVLPTAISPGPGNQIFFDSSNGEFIWDAPRRQGEYNIAIRINEYRNGILINSIIRDMQINVQNCDNRPPQVLTADKICVVAGEEILLDITVTDPDEDQLVRLEGSGGPFLISPSPATINVSTDFMQIPLTAQFNWDTRCEHIAESDYSVVFKGEDNFFRNTFDTTGLVDLRELSIHVSGPAPANIDAQSMGQMIQLSWDSPYDCDMTLENYFRGFTIWRKLIPTNVIIDTCGTDLNDYNYTPIAFQVNTQAGNRYFYNDENVDKGVTYCYRVTAEFAKLSLGGNPFNRVQSLPSDEICLQVSRDLPLITHVTVDSTSTTEGQITIRWVPPLAIDLDTVENPGPYRYILLRSPGIGTNNFTPVSGAVFDAMSFSQLSTITEFIDKNINTVDNGYTYALDFFATNINSEYGQSQSASSVFLNIIGTDRRAILNWTYEVPWFVENHIIFRQDQVTGVFDSITMTADLMFDDFPVENDVEYCYFIKTIGSYGLADIPDPLENLSQIVCAVPVDSVPPCKPSLMVINNCDNSLIEPIDDFLNILTWHYATGSCIDSSDISVTEIYFISDITGDTILVASLDDSAIRTFEHQLENEETGCYLIRAIDTNGNVGEFSDEQCLDICPDYMLPNVFTPNNDGANDVFMPFRYRFITQIDMKIYTRWGTLVFETQDPDINWQGLDQNENELDEGVYFYTCETFSGRSSSGFQFESSLEGYITLIRE